jgi:hypothetical protein
MDILCSGIFEFSNVGSHVARTLCWPFRSAPPKALLNQCLNVAPKVSFAWPFLSLVADGLAQALECRLSSRAKHGAEVVVDCPLCRKQTIVQWIGLPYQHAQRDNQRPKSIIRF